MKWIINLLSDELKDEEFRLDEAIKEDKPYSKVTELQKKITDLEEAIGILEKYL